MASKKIINSSESAVNDAIEGLVLVNNGLTTMCSGRVVIRSDVDEVKKSSKVTIVSGGGSGHEPAWAGYVGPGMLTASVCGNVFASPPSSTIYETIVRCAQGNSAGTLVIVKNYTGDRVNFGLAMERAKALGLRCEMVVAAEDCALMSSDRSAGRRGLCGAMLMHKVAGALSDAGKSLDDIVKLCTQVNDNMGTIGVSLGACSLPGSTQPLFTLSADEIELGLGIHGEAGVRKASLMSAKQLVEEMYNHMTNINSASHLPLKSGDRVAVVINNLGGTSYLELNIVAKEIIKLCVAKGLNIERSYCGTFVTSLEMPGISITILKVDDVLLECLDSPTQAPAWSVPWRSEATHGDVTDSYTPSSDQSGEESLQSIAIKVTADSAQMIKSTIAAACQSLIKASSALNELDEGCGDGDTGTTLSQGSQAILSYLETVSNDDLCKPALVFSRISTLIEKHMGGTSGALYGLFFSAAATNLVSEVSEETLIQAFENGISAIMKYGRSQQGDRTMLDALIPCLSALKCPDKVIKSRLQDGSEAARSGANSTAGLKAKSGRASYTPVEQQTRVDPGAEAVAIWVTEVFTALSKAL